MHKYSVFATFLQSFHEPKTELEKKTPSLFLLSFEVWLWDLVLSKKLPQNSKITTQ